MSLTALSSRAGYLGQFHHKICNAEMLVVAVTVALLYGSHCKPEQTGRGGLWPGSLLCACVAAYQTRTMVVIRINV